MAGDISWANNGLEKKINIDIKSLNVTFNEEKAFVKAVSMLKLVSPFFAFVCFATNAFGHELWIEPEIFQVETGARVSAEIVNGQKFEGLSLPYATRSIIRLELSVEGQRTPIEGRLGDRPAIKLNDLSDGLNVIGYESKASFLRYSEWEKFQAFADHKDFPNALEKHLARGLSQDEVLEGYSRFSKALLGVGSANGLDHPFGFEAELVALNNPYLTNGPLSVALLYQGAPLPDHQIEVFDRDPDGVVSTSFLRTGPQGTAEMHPASGHVYMLDAVIFREASDKILERMDVQWETLWANLTFAAPN